jgi:chromosome segregation ATPase
MSEDTTKDLHGAHSFEERVLAELSSMRTEFSRRFDSLENRLTSFEGRLTSLEDKVDARLRETRPMWEALQAQMKEINKRLDTLDRKFDALIKDLFNLRVRVERLEDERPTG